MAAAAILRHRAVVVAPTLLLVVLGLGAVLAERQWPFAITGLLDEPAHLATAGLVLLAMTRGAASRYGGWMLVGSVVIDIDHLPLYLGDRGFLVDGARPPTHSVAVIALLLLAALAIPSWRRAFIGLACGVLAHFLRDVATGPGLALLWPAFPETVKIPYSAYLGLLGLLTLGAILRNRAEQSTRPDFAPGEVSQ